MIPAFADIESTRFRGTSPFYAFVGTGHPLLRDRWRGNTLTATLMFFHVEFLCNTFTPWFAFLTLEASCTFIATHSAYKELKRYDNDQGRFTLIFLSAPNDEAAQV